MDYKELLEGLGKSLGIEDFKLGEDGHCSLAIDDVVVSFGERTESGRFDMVAKVCELTSDESGLIYEVLLSAMVPGGSAGDYVFFVDDNLSVYLRWTDVPSLLDVKGLRQSLERFVNAIEDWREEIGNFRRAFPAIDKAAQRQSDEDRRFAVNTEGFLQV